MSDALAQFNDQQEADKACNAVRDRMVREGYMEEEIEENAAIMLQFAGIATVHMIRQRGGIPVPGNPNERIPYDLKMAKQTMALFTEGMYHTFSKCRELRVKGKIKEEFLKQLALEVFNQVDNVVASTLGQDNTPGFQIDERTQLDLIYQTAESALLYMITEYEKKNGPIAPPEENALPPRMMPPGEPVMMQPSLPSMADPGAPVLAAPPGMPRPPQPVQARAKGPSPHDKYAAVALMLATMPAKRQEKIVAQFNAEEKELIRHYGDVAQIEATLDLSSVEGHLKRFSEMMIAGGAGLKTSASDGIKDLIMSASPETMLAWVGKDRPLVKKYMRDLVTETQGGEAGGSDAEEVSAHLPALTPKMEEVLYRYLHKQHKGPEKTEARAAR